MSIEVQHVTKTFGDYTALNDVSHKVNDGELVALLGPSGSGKTTLLRIIAGLEVPNDDPRTQILFHGKSVVDHHVGDRKVGFVFQHYALFKHMTVYENIAFGLRVRPRRDRPTANEIHKRVTELLGLIQLDNMGNRYPSQLSGGQRQRVALARALAIQPKVLLLDEPFGALDAKVRQGLRNWLRRLHDELHMTSILVTHDQEEALEVSDRVVVMNQARIEQVGTPEQVFHNPATEFVMDFLGNVNVFHGRIEGGKPVISGFSCNAVANGKDTHQANVYVRPHELDLVRYCNGEPAMAAIVSRINPAGSFAKIGVTTAEGREIQVDLPYQRYLELELKQGESIFVSPRRIRVFSPDYSI
jgi:sulfate transport system ATP-binding protein